MSEAYCVKCKAKVTIKDEVATVTSNGRPMKKGTCPTCGTKVNVFTK